MTVALDCRRECKRGHVTTSVNGCVTGRRDAHIRGIMQLVTLDLETYFDADYSLRKMTTEAYVRDNRFKIHCCAWRVGDNPANVSPTVPALDWENCAVVCHNTAFDAFALSHHLGIRPGFLMDTLSMARLVYPHLAGHSLEKLALALQSGSPKTVPYQLFKGVRDLSPEIYAQLAEGCKHDVELTYDIFKKTLPMVPKDELRVIDLTLRMFTEPALSLDRPRLTTEIQTIIRRKQEALLQLNCNKEDLQSAETFANLLRLQGVEPPTKASPTTPGKQVYAFAKTDADFKELLEHDNLTVQALVEARLGQKSTIGETRAQRLLDMDLRGALPVFLNYCGAHTTRWSGGDKMNWQNFTRGSELRKSILAPPGYVLVVGDLSQIECRFVNWLAGQEDMLNKFRNNEDIYSELATRFYGEHVDKSKPEKRGTGKQIELSCGFGAGADSIKETARRGTYGPPVHLTDTQALAARDLYRNTHPKVKEMWSYAQKRIIPDLIAGNKDYMWGPMRVYGQRIYIPGGTFIDYSNLHYNGKDYYQAFPRKGHVKAYGGKMVQNVVEALARAILAGAALKIADRYKVVLLTHDEVVCLAKEEEADEALSFVLNTLKTNPKWCINIPLEAEGGYARNYSK